jgi:hypothetical protein
MEIFNLIGARFVKKPTMLALVVGALVVNPAFAQLQQASSGQPTALRAYKIAEKERAEALKNFNEKKERLAKDLVDPTDAGVTALLEVARACAKFTSTTVREFVNNKENKPPQSHADFVNLYKNEATLSGDMAKTACYMASDFMYTMHDAGFVPRFLCMTLHQRAQRDDSSADAQVVVFESDANALKGPGGHCGEDIGDAVEAQKRFERSDEEFKQALARLKESGKEN